MSRVLPILFNTEMVRAILDGRKTVTRRAIMPRNRRKAKEQGYNQGYGLWVDPSTDNGDREGHIKDYSISPCWISYSWYISKYAPYQPGDILYVRETFFKHKGHYYYKADGKHESLDDLIGGSFFKWHPSVHMPKEAARIWLRCTNVGVERLQEITEEQAKAEGIRQYTKDGSLYKYAVTDDWWADYHRKHNKSFNGNWWQDMPRTAKRAFLYLWNSTLKKSDLDRYGWDANPWVWAIELERCEKPESEG